MIGSIEKRFMLRLIRFNLLDIFMILFGILLESFRIVLNTFQIFPNAEKMKIRILIFLKSKSRSGFLNKGLFWNSKNLEELRHFTFSDQPNLLPKFVPVLPTIRR